MTLYILHLTQQTSTRNSGVYEFDLFRSSAGIHMCPTSAPETVCSSRRVAKLTLKFTKETTAFVKTTMNTVITRKRNNPSKGVNF